MSLKTIYIKFAFLLMIALGLVTVQKYCNVKHSAVRESEGSAYPSLSSDLSEIFKRGKIIALTDNSSTSYFVYKGEPMGFEYEMLEAFADNLGVDLEIKIAKDMNTILEQLNSGEADIVAANLTVTAERSTIISFTDPLLLTPQVLIQKKPEGWRTMPPEEVNKYMVRNTVDLIGKEIHVRKGSSFYSRLKNLEEEIGGKIHLIEVPGEIETEQLIEMVAKGEIPFTIADQNVALINQTYYSNIDVKTEISFPQKISWAVNKNANELLSVLNIWLNKKKKTSDYFVIYNKYFKSRKDAEIRNESEYFSLKGGKISAYDELIKKYSSRLDWDWRLLASMIYQESHFDTSAQSWAGACGLMQIIPATSVRYGIDSACSSPIESINAGTKYLQSLDNYWKNNIQNKNERIKFVLASYNVGLGHIIDARNLCVKYNMNPGVWENNVAFYLLKKSQPKYFNDEAVKYGYCRGQEPVNYVREILDRFEHYKNVIKPQEEAFKNYFAKTSY